MTVTAQRSTPPWKAPPTRGSTWLLAPVLFALGISATGCSQSAAPAEAVGHTKEALVSIPAPEPGTDVSFGDYVAVDDQTLVVGDQSAAGLDPMGHVLPKGRAYVYTRGATVNDWQLLQVLKPFSPTVSEVHFGQRLTLRGNLLIVSAYRDALDCGTYPCPNASDDQEQGSFYVYRRPAPGQPFVQVGTKYTKPNAAPAERFGYFVATNGTFIAAANQPGSSATTVEVYAVQSDGSVAFRYAVDVGAFVFDMAMTDSGALVVLKASPGVAVVQLQQSQAVPLANASAIADGSQQITSNGNSVALLNTGTGVVQVAPIGATAVGTVVSIAPDPSVNAPTALSLVENQQVLVSDLDTIRKKISKYTLGSTGWAYAGAIYPPIASRLVDESPWTVLASSSHVVAASRAGQVIVSSNETGARLEGATFEKQRLLPTDTCGTPCSAQNYDDGNFGWSASMAGNVAAVMEPALLSGALSLPPPSVHIYTRTAGGSWQHAKEIDFSAKLPRSVAVNSGRVYIGQGTQVPGAIGDYSDGSVLVYEQDSTGSWGPTATLTATDDGSFQSTFLGDEISARGDTVAVGSYGAAYIFQRSSSGTWSQTQKLAMTFPANQGFAQAVSLSDGYLAVGAFGDSTLADHQGSVFVFRRSDWGLDQQLTDPLNLAHHDLGRAVAADGNTIVAGAPDVDPGVVYVWQRTGSGTTPWQLQATLAPLNGDSYRVGTSVSVVGDRILAGAIGDGLTGNQGGAAYLFMQVAGAWSTANAHILLPSDFGHGDEAAFGWTVQLDGTSAIVTAPKYDLDGVFDTGAAYMFDGLVDADGDGLLAADDCNDSDGIAASCAIAGANMSFEPPPQPQWTATSGSVTLSTTHTDGATSLDLGPGFVAVDGPLFSSAALHEIGTMLAFDVQRPTTGSNAVTLFYSAPALNVSHAVIGTVDLSALPAGQWQTVSLNLPAALHDLLVNQTTQVQFHFQFNSGGPGILVDRLHFTGVFASHPAPPPAGSLTAAVNVTSDSGGSYCASITLTNNASIPTSGWAVTLDTKGATINSQWNAAFSGSSGVVTITSNAPWNASVPAGATAYNTNAGFCATRPAGSTALPTIVGAVSQ